MDICNDNNMWENVFKFDKEDPSKSDFLSKIILLVFGSRIAIFIFTYLIQMLYKREYISFFKYMSMWFIQDTPRYINIAQYGYQAVGEDKVNIAFYPLYPLLIRVLNYFVCNYAVSGIFVSCICLIITCHYIYKIIIFEFNNRGLAKQAVILLLIFPYSFFFGIVYTESLFLAASAMVFYYARQRRWLLAGLCGVAGSLTKNQGLFLFIPIIIEILLDDEFLSNLKALKINRSLKYLFKTVPFSILPFSGFGIYLLINKIVFGEWFKFLEYQRTYWSNSMCFFADSVKKAFMCYLSCDKLFAVGTFIPQVTYFFIAIVLIMISVKKTPLSYTIFALAVLVFSYSPTWLLSGPRYISGMFPIYVFISLIIPKNRELKYSISVLSVLLLLLHAATFINGGTY